MSRQVSGEELRLRRVFEQVFLVAAAATAAVAPLSCGASANGSGGSGGASATMSSGTSTSATTTSSGTGGSMTTTTGTGGSADADAGAADAGDGGTVSCDPYAVTPDPPDSCGNYVRLPCGLPADVTPAADCYLLLADCAKFCPGSYFNCHAAAPSCTDAGTIVDDPQGGVTLDCSTCPGSVGRTGQRQ